MISLLLWWMIYFLGSGSLCLNEVCLVALVFSNNEQDDRAPAIMKTRRIRAISRNMLFIEKSFVNKRIISRFIFVANL